MNDHERIDTMLRSHERAWMLKAAFHEAAAEKGRGEKKRAFDTTHGMPDHVKENLSHTYDTAIGHHVRQSRAYRRRAEHARAGFVLDGPEERSDAEYRMSHGDLIRTAHQTGRLRHSDESAPTG